MSSFPLHAERGAGDSFAKKGLAKCRNVKYNIEKSNGQSIGCDNFFEGDCYEQYRGLD